MSDSDTEHRPPPRNAAEMRERLATGLDEFLAAIDQFDERQLTEPKDPAGWNARDHIVHLAVWADGVAALLRREDRWAAMGIADPGEGPVDYDAVNEEIAGPLRSLSLAEARARLVAADEGLRDAVAALSDEELELPYGRYIPPFNSDEGNPVGHYVVGNSFEHYEEHLPWIRAIVARG